MDAQAAQAMLSALATEWDKLRPILENRETANRAEAIRIRADRLDGMFTLVAAYSKVTAGASS